MRWAAVALLVVVGCSVEPEKKPDPAPVQAPKEGAKVEPAWKPAPKPKTLKVRYQGRDAAQWADQLQDADSLVSVGAARALVEIGADEGLPYLEDAIINGSHPTGRRTAIQHLPEKWKQDREGQWVPLLSRALKDTDWTVRVAAANKAADFKYTGCVKSIEQALAVEKNPDAARALRWVLTERF